MRVWYRPPGSAWGLSLPWWLVVPAFLVWLAVLISLLPFIGVYLVARESWRLYRRRQTYP